MWEPGGELDELVGVLAARALETERPQGWNKLGEVTIEDGQKLVQIQPVDRQRMNGLESPELLKLENYPGVADGEIEVHFSYIAIVQEATFLSR